jgi:uncharacterized protein (TIGR02996 family)
MTATTTVTPAPPWSLSVLAPWAAEILDKRPDDHTARQAFADIVEEAGYPDHAERLRWVARAGRRPANYSDCWGWCITNDSDHTDSHSLSCLAADFSNYPSTGVHNTQRTRQAAEDALIAYLLKFDANPFEAKT